MTLTQLLLVMPLSLCLGCQFAEMGGVDHSEYRVFERDVLKTFHIVNVWTHTLIPAPRLAHVTLVEAIPDRRDSHSLLAIANRTAPFRVVDTNDVCLRHTVEYLTKDIPLDRARWIVGTCPLIVAIGPAGTGSQSSGGNAILNYPDRPLEMSGSQRFATDKDLNALVSTLIVWNAPPEQWPAYPAPQDPPPKTRTVITFARAVGLGDVYKKRLWKSASEAW